MARRREGSSRRATTQTRRLATRLLIVCGAKETEKQYFDALKKAERNSAAAVTFRCRAESPRQVVDYAKSLRDSDPDAFDEVWCVVDVDEFKDIPQAAGAARRNNIHLVVSNPCFELWLLLHVSHCARHMTTSQVIRELCQHLPGYKKAKLRFTDFHDGIDAARQRARDLDAAGTEHQRNPSTNAWQLVDKIRRQTD